MPPPRQEPPPATPAERAAAGLGVTAGATAAGATAGGASAGAGAGLSTAAVAKATNAILAALARFWKGSDDDEDSWLWLVVENEYPEWRERREDLRALLAAEVEYGAEFRRKQLERLRVDVPAALRSLDPAGALRGLLRREARYIRLRQQAMVTRSLAAVERDALRELSPLGAFWAISPFVAEHTADCLALGNQFWPWEVLDEIHPPMHYGCACRLFGYTEALERSLMTPNQVSDPAVAVMRARDIAKTYGLLEEAADPEELAAAHAALTEYRLEEARWTRRFKEGTKGGQFMPRRGGFSASIRRDLADLLDGIVGRRGAGARKRSERGMAAPALEPLALDKADDWEEREVDPPGDEPAAPPKEPRRPSARSTRSAPADFPEFAERQKELAAELARRHKTSNAITDVTSNPEKEDTAGEFFADGSVEIGRDAPETLQRAARGGDPSDRLAAKTYLTYRSGAHEVIHGVGQIDFADYARPDGFTLEESLTEELAHMVAHEELRRDGQFDALRWRARNPSAAIAEGVYTHERRRLAKVLDEANVPVTARRELMERMAFAMGHEQRLDILAGLVAANTTQSPEVARAEVIATLAGERDGDLDVASVPILAHDPGVDHRAPNKLDVGAVADLPDGTSGLVTDAGYGEDGKWRVEVSVTDPTAPGGLSLRYPDADEAHASRWGTPPLVGAGVEAPIYRDTAVEATLPNGETLRGTLKRVELTQGGDGAWRAQIAADDRETYLLTASRVKSIRPASAPTKRADSPADAAPNTGKGGEPPAGGPQDALRRPTGGSQAVSGAPGGAASPPQKPGWDAHARSGLGYDPRRYSDPRRALLAKIKHLKRGSELTLADGSVVSRGPKESVRIEKPDGKVKLYVTPQRLANAETAGVLERALKELGMPSPAQGDEKPTTANTERGPIAVGDAFYSDLYGTGRVLEILAPYEGSDRVRVRDGMGNEFAAKADSLERLEPDDPAALSMASPPDPTLATPEGDPAAWAAKTPGQRLDALAERNPAALPSMRSPAQANKPFEIVGVSDHDLCELCGKKNLKRTVELKPTGGSDEDIVRYGSECAAMVMGWQDTVKGKKITDKLANEAQFEKERAEQNEIRAQMPEGKAVAWWREKGEPVPLDGYIYPDTQEARLRELYAPMKEKKGRYPWEPASMSSPEQDLEMPPAEVLGIPSYDDAALTDKKAAGGSNGARIAEDEDGNGWLVKTYRGDTDRVATELLANALYRELGVAVAPAGVYHPEAPEGKEPWTSLAYPLIDGETRRWEGEDEQLADGYMADALLANWDVVGLEQDNVLWDEDGNPVRLDQGGTLAYRAMGSPKPFGPVPTEVWTMMSPGGQPFGRMKVTEELMRVQAREIEERLTPERVDELVDAAPFADLEQKEAVREALKARVAWMGAFGRGEEHLPEPAAGDEALVTLREDQIDPYPEEEAALAHYGDGGGRAEVDVHLRSGRKKADASPEVQGTVQQLDALLGASKTKDPVRVTVPVDSEALAAASEDGLEGLVGEWLTEKSYLLATTGSVSGPRLEIELPAGTRAFALEDGTVVVARGAKLRIGGVRVVGGSPVIAGTALTGK